MQANMNEWRNIQQCNQSVNGTHALILNSKGRIVPPMPIIDHQQHINSPELPFIRLATG
jgi:hypothetical protein